MKVIIWIGYVTIKMICVILMLDLSFFIVHMYVNCVLLLLYTLCGCNMNYG